MKIKCRLKVIFAENDIRHGEFAESVGVSKAALSSLVNNKTLPTLPVAYSIAEKLDMKIEDIWIRIDDTK